MRRALGICVLMISLLLTACGDTGKQTGPMERALALRSNFLAAEGCRTDMEVTADYGQRVYTFGVRAVVHGDQTTMEVLWPEEVAGITARLEGWDARLRFDDLVLETGPLDEDGLTPISALTALLDAARRGYMDSCVQELLGQREVLRVLVRDPGLAWGQGREISLWFDEESGALIQGEICVDARRVISCTFTEFTLT